MEANFSISVNPKTFQFARTDGITAEAANVYRRDLWRITSKKQIAQPRGFYRPICNAQEIRVLEIYPGHFWDDLRGSLHHCSVEFDYTWGVANPGTDTLIDCDGFKLPITRSLEMALRHFRHKEHSINLWVDQICINQNDAREKEEQISLMSKIYSHAINTAIWLGEGTDRSEEVFKLLELIDTMFQFEDRSPNPEEFERLFLPHPDDPIWKHLWEMLNRKWFSRLWIIQETILSNFLWVICGNTIAYWKDFAGTCDKLVLTGFSTWLQNKHGNTVYDSETGGCRSIQVLSSERYCFHGQTDKLSLFSTLANTRNAQCFDPRDKVYGLFGICDSNGIKVSYDEDSSVADLYYEVALDCLRTDTARLPRLLSCVDHISKLQDLPSWVPDWSLSRQTSSLGFSTSSDGVYAASGRWWCPSFSIHPNRKELLVQGKIFDVVKETAEVCTVPNIAHEDPRSTNQHILPWIELAKQCFPYPGGCMLFEAFWHTLVAGKDGEGRQKSPATFAEVFSLLLDETTGQCPTFPDQTYSARQRRPEGKGKLELANLYSRTPALVYQEIRSALRSAIRNQRLGTTAKGYLGLLPRQAKPGDIVCVLFGCNVPFIIRKADGDKYRLVGECYVHGIMRGEVINMDDVPYIVITLV
ncbi:uncharacterized protein K452DRAFT_353118 [Aplosporella prunicola CBS 121167]|uniref:Heterokaryon incompatibility domain-containing protein n=1 Tax=Aplosporella prunicola CBS 121167 TaxID=1176127 RepID=A0A6A6B609_9PEZI|nr:uncharacterized protein K452DRAFT_353118 [Aplosporella prunicola CBS 121167]KAF2138221.1 hypothetical protein K452DRAFT_353118 [Aplosporella prunicola CBS 121167]